MLTNGVPTSPSRREGQSVPGRLPPARFSLCLLLIAFLTGCTDREADRGSRGSTAFATIANAESEGWVEGSGWTLVEDLRLGTGPTGPDVEQFGRIQSIVSDSSGRILVLDGLAQHIRVFDPSGEYLHTIGRKGSGPGEFTGAKRMAVGRGDTLWVIDDGEMRYSVLGSDGRFITSYPRTVRGFISPASGALLADGSFVDWDPRQPDGRNGPRMLYTPLRLAPPAFRPDSLPPILHTWRMIRSGRLPVTRLKVSNSKPLILSTSKPALTRKAVWDILVFLPWPSRPGRCHAHFG